MLRSSALCPRLDADAARALAHTSPTFAYHVTGLRDAVTINAMRLFLACSITVLVVACGSANDGAGSGVDADNGPACEDTCTGGDICLQGECVPASCRDSEQGGSETDVDCGGGCLACSEGQQCQTPDDCTSRFCDESNVCRDCQTTPDCSGAEGTYCDSGLCLPVKVLGTACTATDSCNSGFCVDDVCCENECDDGTCSADGVCLIELCDDGEDNDLDGMIDEGCSETPYYY